MPRRPRLYLVEHETPHRLWQLATADPGAAIAAMKQRSLDPSTVRLEMFYSDTCTTSADIFIEHAAGRARPYRPPQPTREEQ